MKIIATWFGNQFNVELASAEGKEPFISIKGCRIMDGTKGEFVSWPATKNERTGKWWNHVYASEGFNSAVLDIARATMPAKDTRTQGERRGRDEAPF